VGLFQLLLRGLKSFRPLEVDDEFFGHLVYIKTRTRPYWEAERSFSPSGTEIELFIDAPGHEQSPNQAQREFFAWVERDYAAIIIDVERVSRPVFENWFGKPIEGAFEEEFKLSSFSIPLPTDGPAEWEMTFDSRTDREHMLVVTLQGSEARDATMDG
jgi:hypothetical protein